MSILQSILLGMVQGLTEFLPVSSSGHLAILKYIFGLKDIGMTFDVLLHVGTLIAVLAVYYRDIWQLIKSTVEMIVSLVHNVAVFFRRLMLPKDERKNLRYERVISSSYKRFTCLIIVSTIPVAVIGFFVKDYIEKISAGLLVPGICLLITGVVLLLADAVPEGNRGVKGTSMGHAIGIGIAQACAVFPGLSRSGATISAALICGLKKEFAVKYSFILSIPAILGAAVKTMADVVRGGDSASGGSIGVYIVGMIVAAVIGYVAIRLLLVIIKNNKYKYFAYYCFLAGAVAIIGFFITR